MKRYTITIEVPEDWIEDIADLKKLLEEECNLWSVTHCEPDIEVHNEAPRHNGFR